MHEEAWTNRTLKLTSFEVNPTRWALTQGKSFRITSYKRKCNEWEENNLKELLMPHKLPQGAPTESVEGGVKIGKTCLPLVGPPCLSKVLKDGQSPQRHHLPTIDKEVSPQQVKKESPSHTDTLLSSPLWEKHIIWHQVEVLDGLSGVLPP